ncbi:heme biosynthesis HemY N-terminal domain-containing protein [Profundibacter sp.]
MLWSLIKILLFVAAIAGATFGAGYLMETGSSVVITVANTEFVIGPLMMVLLAVALLVGVWLLLKVMGLLIATFKFLNGDETAISRYFDRNREKRGYEALSEGMLALASGEGRVAMAKAAKAEKYLNKPELTNLLSAQAAEMTGDKRKAEEVYKRLLQDDKTRFVGVRGIMKQKLAEGDTETALALAEKAFAIKPKHEETQDTLLRLQASKEDWGGARKTLGAKLKHGSLPRDVHRRRDAVLALSEARIALAAGDTAKANEAAIEANRLSPDLVPAAVMAARVYTEMGKLRAAARVIKKAWEANPHPDLAAAFAAIAPDETPEARLKRFRALTKLKPDHPETRMLLAELNIAAKDFPAARKALGDLVETDPTARSLTIMAAIERGEGSDDTVVRGWLTKALTASRGPQWVCDNCHSVHSEWAPVCHNCESFDSLSWVVPSEGEVAMPASTEMLPLIVGALEDKVEEPVEEPVVEAEILPDSEPAPEEPEVVADGEVVALGGDEKPVN